ncbi:MAG: succinate dehydrogenase assembly factor 2 [Arenicellales bacterium]
MSIPARVRWRCRRGTKELDALLGRFLEQGYPQLSADQREAFEELLDQQDPDLAAWLWGGEPPPSKWADLIYRIRADSGVHPA